MPRILQLLKSLLLPSFSVLDVAELRTYDWDGIFPRAHWHGWCDLFGFPYRVVFDTGESSVPGGWVDVHHLGQISVNAKVGAIAGINGEIIIQMQVAMSLYDVMMRDTPEDAQFTAEVVANTTTDTIGIVDISHWNYMRLFSVINNANGPITLQAVTHDGVYPVELPAGTPP